MRRQPFKAAIVGGGLQKTMTLSEWDIILDRLADGNGDGDISPQELYKVVAWVFWCVNRRANAVAGMPYLIMPMEVEDDDEDQAVEFGIDLHKLLWSVEAWLSLKGAAYILKVQQRNPPLRLVMLNANTMSVRDWDEYGDPLSFEQRIGTRRRIFQADEIVYFRTFDPEEDVREGIPPGHVGRKPAALIDAINEYGGAFFRNGAIPAVLLTTDGAIPPGEKERVEGVWNKLMRGVRQQFQTVVLERGLTPTVIGQPNSDLAMPEMDESKRDQILAAHLLPPGLAKSVTSRAERDALKAEAYEECYIPECETWIEPTLNDQLFSERNLRLSFQYKQIEVLQKQELEKAEASAFFVSGMMLPAYKENLVSLEETRAVIDAVLLASALPPLDENFEPEERTPPQLLPFTGQEPPDEDDEGTDENAPPTAEERIESRLPKATGSERPKVAAPPRWGQYRIGQNNSSQS